MADAANRRVRLGREVTAAGLARRHVADVAARRFPPDVVRVAQLLVSEVVTNALEHSDGRGDLELEVNVEETIRVEVVDGGRGFDPARAGPQSGRWGLRLLGELSDTYGVSEDGPFSVWFTVGRPARRRRGAPPAASGAHEQVEELRRRTADLRDAVETLRRIADARRRGDRQ